MFFKGSEKYPENYKGAKILQRKIVSAKKCFILRKNAPSGHPDGPLIP